MGPRTSFRFTVLIVLATYFCSIDSSAQTPPTATPGSGAHRIIVKLRPAAADQIEQSLASTGNFVSSNVAAAPPVSPFTGRHHVRSMSPLHPSIVHAKMQRHVSADQLSSEVRQEFSARAQRLKSPFNPPDLSRTYVLQLDSSANADDELDQLRSDPDVEYAEPDRLITFSVTPNDPYLSSIGSWGQTYADLWGIKAINAPSAWNTSTGNGVVVAVVDTGLDYTHPDIAANVWMNGHEIPGNGIDDDHNGFVDDIRGWDFPYYNNDVSDKYGHGTHVAGTIAAIGNNGLGIIGVAWQARIMAVKVGLNDGTAYVSDLAAGVVYSVNNGADVINASWAVWGDSPAITDAVNYAHDMGAVFVAAAGNSTVDAREYSPANLPNAITVAATGPDGTLAYFSNFGPKIDVAAPGVDILSLRATGTNIGSVVGSAGYVRASGTSMAAPHVAGAAALILSLHPEYSNEQVREVIRASASDIGSTGFDLKFGYGGLNASAATTVTNPLEARILGIQYGNSPMDPIRISGTARGNGFSQYTLEYGAGDVPVSWTFFKTGTTEVAGGELGEFDPTLVPNGVYSIRLTAYNTNGSAFVDRVTISVNAVSILTPSAPADSITATTYKAGKLVPIVGTAVGAGFQNFKLEWAAGVNATSGWNTAGITLSGAGLAPVNNSQLGAWNTSAITQAGYYTIRLSVTSNYSGYVTTVVYLEPDLMSSNWPVWLDQGSDSGVVPVLGTDGTLRLAAISGAYGLKAALWILSSDGLAQKTQLLNCGNDFPAAAADIDDGAGDEIVVEDCDRVRIFHQDKQPTVFTPAVPGLTAYFQTHPVLVEDVEGDGQMDIVGTSYDYTNKTEDVYVWRPNGQLLGSRYPIRVANTTGTSYDNIRTLVADFQGTGNKQIAVLESPTATTFTIRLFTSDGTPIASHFPTLTGVPQALIAADLDHNGTLEIILALHSGSQVELHVFQPDGSERPGWPFVAAYNTGMWAPISLAAGDLDRDGREEIVFAHQSELYVFKTDRTLFSSAWPLRVGWGLFFSALIGDIDGDGRAEIVTARSDIVANGRYDEWKLQAIRGDGSVARSWLITGTERAYPGIPRPAIGDFNQDGITDIAYTVHLFEPGPVPGLVSVVSTGGPYDSTAMDWPLLFHDARNTAVLTRSIQRPTITYSPDNLDFGGVLAGTSSPSQRVTIQNLGPGTLKINSVTVGGSSAQDYTAALETSVMVQRPTHGDVTTTMFESANDSFSIAPGSSAVVDVTFSPTARGSRPATLILADNATGSPHHIPLSGVGMEPDIELDQTSISFDWQGLNVASPPLAVNISNTGDGPLTVSSLSITGGNASDFAIVPTVTPFTVAPGSSKQINVIFTPSDIGPRTGVLSITHNAGSKTSVISLSGIGQKIVTTAQFTPALLDLGTIPVGESAGGGVLIYNSGGANLLINKILIKGPNADEFSYWTPSMTVGPGSMMSLSVLATNVASVGKHTATIWFYDNAVGSPHQIALSVTAKAAAVLHITPTSLEFGKQNVGTVSAPLDLTFSNPGSEKTILSGLSMTGINAAEFSLMSPPPLPITIDPKTSVTLKVRFAPAATGVRTGGIQISANIPNLYGSYMLTGTGTIPILTPSGPGDFGQIVIGKTSTARTAVLTNTGSGKVTVSALTLIGPNAADFAFASAPALPVTIQPGESANVNVTFTPSATGTRTASIQVTDDASGSPHLVPLSGTGVLDGPSIWFSPINVAFGNQQVNTTSSPVNLKVSNIGSQNLVITAIQIAGANSTEFAVVAPALPLTISPGASTNIPVTFKPTGPGFRTAQLTFTDNGIDGAQSVPMIGTGLSGQLAANPASVTFADQALGTTSPAKSVTISNQGNQAALITGFQMSGSDASSFFVVAPPGLPATLNAGSSLTINVAFVPARVGSGISATLNVNTSNAGIASIALSGNGLSASNAKMSLNTTALEFPVTNLNTASAAKPIVISNIGTTNVAISSVTISGTNASDFTFVGPTAPFSVSPQSSTVLSVTFKPGDLGPRTATMTIVDNAAGSPHIVTLTGTGAVTGPAIRLNPASLAFPTTNLGSTSAAQTLTISNPGTSALSVSALRFSGANAGDFSYGTVALPMTVAAGSSTTLNLLFTPTSEGARSATLNFTDNASSSPIHSVTLNGTALSAKANLSPSSKDFGPFNVNQNSAPAIFSVTNTGTNNLVVTSIGSNNPAFHVLSTFLPGTLSPGDTASVLVTFSPTTAGAAAGTLTVTSNAATLTASLSGFGLSGTWAADPLAYDFLSLTVGMISTDKPFSIRNVGTTPLTIYSVSAGGPNTDDFVVSLPSLPSTIPVGQSLPFSASFKPTANGQRHVTLTFVDSAPTSSPHQIDLFGTGVAPSVAAAMEPAAFPDQPVNTTSAPSFLRITNNGSASLTVASLTIGGTNASAFQIPAGGAILPLTISAGNSVTVPVTFTPTAAQSYSGKITVSCVGINIPPVVPLSGRGIGSSKLSYSPATGLAFGNQVASTPSAPLTLVLSNTGNDPLTISSLALGGINSSDFAITSAPSLPITIAPNSSQVAVQITYKPTAIAPSSAALVVTGNMPGGTVNIPLSGVGVGAPKLQVSASLAFGSQLVGLPSSSMPLVINNTGSADLVISGITLAGTSPSDFGIAPTTFPLTITAGSSASLNVKFTPAITGPRTATLLIAHNSAGMTNPAQVILTGNGVQPVIVFNPPKGLTQNTLSFGTAAAGIGVNVPLVVANTGTADLVINSLTISGTHASDFSFGSVALPLTVPAGSQMTLTLTFNPKANGQRTATLTFSDNAAGGLHTVTLSGIGNVPVAVITPLARPLDFGTSTVDVAVTRAVSVSNSGNTPLKITAITVTGDAASDFTVTGPATPVFVQPGVLVPFTVTFRPTASGTRNATVGFVSNSPSSPDSVALTGVGQSK